MEKKNLNEEKIELSKETHLPTKEDREFNEAVERYRRTVFGAKTPEERAKAINKFRCGY